MKRKVGIFSAIALSGSGLLAIALSSTGVTGNLFVFRSEADLSYTLTLSNSNKYDGNATQYIYNDNNNYAVQFSYSGCTTNQSGHVTLNANGTLKNDQQITSVSAIYPVFTASNGASLKFRASYNGTKWGEYSVLTSEKTFDLAATNPYFIELKADGGSINLTSLRYTYTCAANPAAASGEEEWQIVTDEKDLAVGDQVVIAAAESDVSYALSTTQNSNNISAVSITKDNEKGTIIINNSVQVLTLEEGSSDDLFAFNTGDGYLKACSSGSNYLRTETDITADSSFRIKISDEQETLNYATVDARDSSYTRDTIRYNPNNGSPIFSCYSSTSTNTKPISIYKKTASINTPAYETGLTVEDAKGEAGTYIVTENFDSFVENGGLTVTAMMSDGSSKKLSKSEYSYKMTYGGVEQDPTQKFQHAGEYSVSISYKSLIPNVYTINVANVVTSVTATKETTSYHVNDNIVLNDITAVKNYAVDGSSSSIAYSNFSANGLSLELRNPNNQLVTSGTFNVAGNWTAKVYLTANSEISSSITISVTAIPVSSISLNTGSVTVYVGGSSETLTATVLPNNATDKTVIWSIINDNPKGCLSISNGTITGYSAGTATVVATAGDKQATCNVTISTIAVTGVSLNKDSLTISAGKTETLSATISPANASNTAVNWTSTNTNIATVNANGVVTAVAPGTATITVTTVDGEKTTSCSVTVTKIGVTSVTLSKSSLDLYVGGSDATLTATVLPNDATYKTVTWSSNKSNIATVTNGVVHPVGVGTAVISASADGVSANCTVNVAASAPEWIKVTDENDLSAGDKVIIGDENANVTATNISGTYLGKVTSTFSDQKVTTLGSGTIEFTLGGESGAWTFINGDSELGATSTKTLCWDDGTTTWDISISDGDATIWSTTESYGRILYNSSSPRFTNYGSSTNVSGSMRLPELYRLETAAVVPDNPVSSINLSTTGNVTNLFAGETLTINKEVLPANADNKNVTWSSSDTSIATVSQSGVVTGVSSGSVTITATAKDGSGTKGTINLTVNAKLDSIEVSNEKTSYKVGDNFVKPTVTASYIGGSDKDVTNSATFNGFSSASAGNCTITVSYTENGVTKSTSYEVTITNSATPQSENFQITFATASTDSSSEYGSGSVSATILSAGSSYVSSYSCSKAYKGTSGIKLGSSKSSGYVSLNFSSTITSVNVTSISYTIAQYSSDSKNTSLYVNGGSSAVSTTSNGNVYTYTLSSPTSISSLKISSQARVYIVGITISTQAATPVDVTSISLNQSAINMTSGETYPLVVSYNPSGANTNTGITWTSSNSSVAEVSSTGVVSAKSQGYATITATTENNKSDTCTVTVTSTPVTSVSINEDALEMKSSSTKQLSATVLPYNASNKNVTWSSSNTSVATVSSTGLVSTKNVSSGSATITVTTADGGHTDTCNVTINTSLAKWTVLMYVCGADLESDYADDNDGCATDDLREIASVSGQPSDVNVVVQAGGASKWSSEYSSVINKDKANRFHLKNKSFVKDEQINKANMGLQSTLQSFLAWGFDAYPAENTAIIFWDHGGAMEGCCYDEQYGDDSLLSSEITAAIKGARNTANEKNLLEFVGYDCCLMQVQDIAGLNSQYAKYQVASEESEWGYGWSYDKWIDDLFNKRTTPNILKACVDGFATDTTTAYQNWGDPNDQTLSYLNLSYWGEYEYYWESMASSLQSIITSSSKWTTYKNLVNSCQKYGSGSGNAYNNGYRFDVFDAGDYFSKISQSSTYNSNTELMSSIGNLQTVHSKLVEYEWHGSAAGNSTGLTFFCPIGGYNSKSVQYATGCTPFTNWRNLVVSYGKWSS